MAEVVCTSCGWVGEPKEVGNGSVWIGVLLWVTTFILGLLYTVWRWSIRYEECPSCGRLSLFPTHSETAKKFFHERKIRGPLKIALDTNGHKFSIWFGWIILLSVNGLIIFLWLTLGLAGGNSTLILGAKLGVVVPLFVSMYFMIREKFKIGLAWVALVVPLVFGVSILLDIFTKT